MSHLMTCRLGSRRSRGLPPIADLLLVDLAAWKCNFGKRCDIIIPPLAAMLMKKSADLLCEKPLSTRTVLIFTAWLQIGWNVRRVPVGKLAQTVGHTLELLGNFLEGP